MEIEKDEWDPFIARLATVKHVAMTDEYAANFFMQQGYYAAKIDALIKERKEENNGDRRS